MTSINQEAQVEDDQLSSYRSAGAVDTLGQQGVLQPFGENIWIVEGPDVRDMGMLFTTRMTVIKLSDGALWIESPVAVPVHALQRITDLGPVRYLVAITPRHVWRLAQWHSLFPSAQLWATKTTAVTLMPRNLPLTGFLGKQPLTAWSADLDQLAFQGSPLIEEDFILHRASRTVIVGDTIQMHPLIKGKPLRNLLVKASGLEYPHGGVSPDIRLAFTDRAAARESLRRLLAWDFERLILAHGPCILKDAKDFVERTFRWLDR